MGRDADEAGLGAELEALGLGGGRILPTRVGGRTVDQLRNTKITPNISPYAEGGVAR